MIVSLDKQYRTESGLQARIYATDGKENFPFHGAVLTDKGWIPVSWQLNGKFLSQNFDLESHDFDLVEIKPCIKRTIWVNIDQDGYIQALDSRNRADSMSHNDRIACVKIEISFKEGDGL